MGLAQIAPYGGITVMLPAAVVIGAWLWFSGNPRGARLWGATLLSVYCIVAFSKILFKGWGIGLESLNIEVISGHAMNTCLVLTVTLSLLARQFKHSLRWPAAALGLLLGWLFAVNCVAPYIHPLEEAVAGALLGSMGACVFLYCLEETAERVKIPGMALALGLMFMAFNATTPKYTAEHLLNHVAVTISGGERAYAKPEWRSPEELSEMRPSS
ncbi:phosphatase PAP2 family protein [Pseudomonas sp. NA-150]|uniref:phosphatase PAP2 family protein n=1 Tax=Pseudomonas sp. NA-150 TaxID=3367525 RepID=UPI0037C6B092